VHKTVNVALKLIPINVYYLDNHDRTDTGGGRGRNFAGLGGERKREQGAGRGKKCGTVSFAGVVAEVVKQESDEH